MKKVTPKKVPSGICIYCNKPGARGYSVHGRGKGSKINYFHEDCYLESIGKLKDPNYTGR